MPATHDTDVVDYSWQDVANACDRLHYWAWPEQSARIGGIPMIVVWNQVLPKAMSSLITYMFVYGKPKKARLKRDAKLLVRAWKQMDRDGYIGHGEMQPSKAEPVV